jgi:glycosyltransferase involved in cell wall biosynthesis
VRILHAIRSDGFAGVERHVVRLAVTQAEAGDDVHVVGGDEARMSRTLAVAEVGHSRGETVGGVIAAIRRRRAWADVVHVHMTAAELAGAVATWQPRRLAPMITTRHFPLLRGRSPAGRIAAGFVRSRLRAQIAISRYVADRVEGTSTVVYPGVDVAPDARSAAERSATVLVVQRLEPEKDTRIAIEAFARSGLAGRGWRLDIVGNGSQRAALQQLAESASVSDSVRFLGEREDVAALMARSSLLVAPCSMEGLGLSVLEAMAVGLPIVACATGGHLETLPNRASEVCFAVGDTLTAAKAIKRLAADADLRDELAVIGQQRQRAEFTLQAQAAATRSVYSKLM